MAEDLSSRYRMLKEEGVSPETAYRTARRQGLDIPEALETIGKAYGLSEAQTRRLVEAEDPAERPWPPLESREALLATLRGELGYCDCAPDETLSQLRDFLRAVRDRSDAVDDAEAFARASRALEDGLPFESASALTAWFVYGLQQRDLVWHGFRLTDVWITDRGRRLLQALEKFC